ncbi:hypothetical protein [Streptosporangium sandarakinum]
MYDHVTPAEYESAPVTGAFGAGAPGVTLNLSLELTQEEAAAVLARFTVGLHEDDPRITPANVSQVLSHVFTDVALDTIRTAARDMGEAERQYPEDGSFYAWCRRIVRPTVPRQRARRARVLTGSAVA